jgi:hypothetical protein
MKKVVVLLFISLIIFSSCNSRYRRYRHHSDVTVATVKAIKVDVVNTFEKQLIRPLDGTRNIQNSMDILAYSWLQTMGLPYYKEWGMDKNPGFATPEASIQQYVISNAKTLKDVFRSLPQDMEWRWMTQNQVVEFCLGHRDFIRNSGKDIIFFCKKDENKSINDRNLSEEVFAIGMVTIGGNTRIIINRLDYDNSDASFIVITTKEKNRTIEF